MNKLDWARLILWKGPFQIDLMATPYNRLLPVFVSPFPHPQALAVDVKMVDWNRWSIVYMFPPPAMLPWILDRLLTFKGEAVIIARVQKLHPCYPIIRSIMKDSLPLVYPPFQLVREKKNGGLRTLVLSMDRISFLGPRLELEWSKKVTNKL